MKIEVRTKEQQAIDNLKAIVNSKDKIIEIEPPIEDTAQILLDYITNLQEENQALKNQLDFIEEQNHIIDKLEKVNEKLKENAIHNDKVVDKAKWNEMIYKSRNEKAIEYLANCDWNCKDFENLYDILNGGDDNE